MMTARKEQLLDSSYDDNRLLFGRRLKANTDSPRSVIQDIDAENAPVAGVARIKVILSTKAI